MTAKEYADWWGVDEPFIVELCENHVLKTARKSRKRHLWHVSKNESLLKYVEWVSPSECRLKNTED